MKKLFYVTLDYRNSELLAQQQANYILKKLAKNNIDVYQVLQVTSDYYNDTTYVEMVIIENENTEADIKKVAKELNEEQYFKRRS